MANSLAEIVQKKRFELNKHALVNQFNKLQKQDNQEFYLKQAFDKDGISTNDQISHFYNTTQFQSLFLLEIDEQLHDLKIVQALTQNQQIEFDFERGKGSGLTRNQKIERNVQYECNVTKTIEGLGFHRNLKYKLDVDLKHVTNNETNQCQVAMLDYLDYDQYLDIEEFNDQKQFKLRVEEVIDVEKPSMVSSQHYYSLQFNISESTNFEFTVPIHFRYRNPSDILYKESHVNSRPKVYMNCKQEEDIDEFMSYVDLKWYLLDVSHKYRIKVNDNRNKDEFVTDEQIKQSVNNYQEYHRIFNQQSSIVVLTPTGQVHHNNIVTVITFSSTILGAFYILYHVLFKKKPIKSKKE